MRPAVSPLAGGPPATRVPFYFPPGGPARPRTVTRLCGPWATDGAGYSAAGRYRAPDGHRGPGATGQGGQGRGGSTGSQSIGRGPAQLSFAGLPGHVHHVRHLHRGHTTTRPHDHTARAWDCRGVASFTGRPPNLTSPFSCFSLPHHPRGRRTRVPVTADRSWTIWLGRRFTRYQGRFIGHSLGGNNCDFACRRRNSSVSHRTR